MADIQFKFENYWGQPAYDFNGDFERGTANGTLDFWGSNLNLGGSSGDFFQSANYSLKNTYSARLTGVAGSYNVWTNTFVLTAGTYRLRSGFTSNPGRQARMQLYQNTLGSTFALKTFTGSGEGTWIQDDTGSVAISAGTYRIILDLITLFPHYFDNLELYKQGVGTINYTVALDDMPTYPYSWGPLVKEIQHRSYYERLWNYRIARKNKWLMNFREVSETCKNNFRGLIYQAEDIFFYNNINNVGSTGGTYIVRIDPESFQPEQPYWNVWNFQIALEEVESAGF